MIDDYSHICPLRYQATKALCQEKGLIHAKMSASEIKLHWSRVRTQILSKMQVEVEEFHRMMIVKSNILATEPGPELINITPVAETPSPQPPSLLKIKYDAMLKKASSWTGAIEKTKEWAEYKKCLQNMETQ